MAGDGGPVVGLLTSVLRDDVSTSWRHGGGKVGAANVSGSCGGGGVATGAVAEGANSDTVDGGRVTVGAAAGDADRNTIDGGDDVTLPSGGGDYRHLNLSRASTTSVLPIITK
ncbi:conserved hypothetical protein [Ricinus communis]|uniref:Uncharacterized protein n=1 Tax=Ricinus communis TaxID=3988 RepID=B9SDQ7_RICCO|nr:conserved hypothetical protein [Ricinus communis]